MSKRESQQGDSKDDVKYIKLDQREHALFRPDMYIGSVEPDIAKMWTFSKDQIVMKDILYIPGLYKIFDEILVNSIDHVERLKQSSSTVNQVKNIKIDIDDQDGVITIKNDGDGIQVTIHQETGLYVPELIFGNLLTSSNFSDNVERTVGGMNGIGAKACNIFSEFFEIETVDHARNLLYTQKFEANMSIKSTPVLKKYTKKPYTQFRFKPDYKRFGTSGLSADMKSILTKRVYDACAMTGVNIFLNNEKCHVTNLVGYANLISQSPKVIHVSPRWEVICTFTTSESGLVSFVNGISTTKNGKHVDYILNQIIKKLSELVIKRNKQVTSIRPQIIKDNLLLVLKSTIVNPSFESQAKEKLTTPIAKFGSTCDIPDKFIQCLYKQEGLLDNILKYSKLEENKSLSKSDGKKKGTLKGIPNLEDAFLAGTKKSRECTLILTEGLSASTFAISGLSIVGRDKYGIFPLKGKVLNVKDTSSKKVAENEEITNLKKILGLENGKVYESVDSLRYGKIMILSDQDRDGSHIKGLIFNLFHTLWKELLQQNFVVSMLTPIVKVKLNKGKELSFYSMQDFTTWKDARKESSLPQVKYFKGLGTSTANEAKTYFKEMKRVDYFWDTKSNDALTLAFDKKQSDARKDWLRDYDSTKLLDYTKKNVSFEDFVHKDLIHFSKYDVERSIPNVVDGLKISQRKILYSAFKRNLNNNEIKVAQFSGYVSEITDYLHGEASLQMAIIGMSQDFVGSNNINYLLPNGQFGTRLHGGKDASQPRYIFTMLNPVMSSIFIPDDKNILKYLDDEGRLIEPEIYIPIIPMILVNGVIGIGTGFSTNIPSHNPKDIIQILKSFLKDQTVPHTDLIPWYKNSTGTIEKHQDKFISKGVYIKKSSMVIEITDLPIGTWTSDYKVFLEQHSDSLGIKSWKNNSTDINISFTLTFSSIQILENHLQDPCKFQVALKLSSTKWLGTTNMYAFDHTGCIRKWKSAFEIIEYFYSIRLDYYKKRKVYLINTFLYEQQLLENKIRFLNEITLDKLVISKITKDQLETLLLQNEYMKHEDSFDYLVKTPLYNLTTDKISQLQKNLVSITEKKIKVESKSVEGMWEDELDNLLRVL